ncbi:MAG: MIP/aquaporin family protein [Acidimicrobiales bacterium]
MNVFTGRKNGRAPHYREPSESETPWIQDPHNPKYELRRLFAEALGTFFLVIATVGAAVVDVKSHGDVPLDVQMIVPGLAIMFVIYTLGGVSGAHVNPVTTFSYALRRNFPWRRVPGYWLAQFVGAVVAVELLRGLLTHVDESGTTVPGHQVSGLSAFLFEAVLTLGMITVTLATASGTSNVGPNAAIARGAYIAAAGLWAGPITGASMNPIRSLAPALASEQWSHLWIYIAGPFLGGALAVSFAWILRGPPTLAADEAAQGSATAGPPGDRP